MKLQLCDGDMCQCVPVETTEQLAGLMIKMRMLLGHVAAQTPRFSAALLTESRFLQTVCDNFTMSTTFLSKHHQRTSRVTVCTCLWGYQCPFLKTIKRTENLSKQCVKPHL